MVPKLVIVGGFPCSGKTLISKMIARKGLFFVDKDSVAKFFTKALLESLGSYGDDRQSELYVSKVKDLEYQTILDVSFENIGLGNSVVVTAPFIKDFFDPTWINNIHQRVKFLGGELVLLWIHTDLDILKQRMVLRREPRDNWKLDNWEEYVSGLPMSAPNEPAVIIVENSKLSEAELYKIVYSNVSL
jgi:predicted kinase